MDFVEENTWVNVLTLRRVVRKEHVTWNGMLQSRRESDYDGYRERGTIAAWSLAYYIEHKSAAGVEYSRPTNILERESARGCS